MSEAKSSFDVQTFLEAIAPQVLAELRPPAELKTFTTNPAVVGGYVEGAVRALVKRYVFPLRVATGAVVDQRNIPGAKDLPQIDTIVWTPSPVPAIFAAGEFAVVPRSSAMGVLEVKSSAYDVRALDDALDPARVAKVTADPPQGDETLRHVVPALGVVCVRQEGQGSPLLEDLRRTDRVVVLFEEQKGSFAPQPADIYKLLNFLASLRLKAHHLEGRVRIRVDLLPKGGPA
jgi:hypothetical protein